MPMMQQIDVPQDHICAITHEIMLDPVVDSQGRAYEREAITRWINQNHTHPTDRTAMKVEDLSNAPALSRLIRVFVEDNPTLYPEVHVPDNTGQLMIDAVNANNNGAVRYLIQASEGNGHRQDWLDGAFPVAAKGMKLDLMRRLHTAGSSMGDFTCTGSVASNWLIFDVVKDQRRQDVLEFTIDNTPRGDISQEVLDEAFFNASDNGDAAMINFLYNAGANVNAGNWTCLYHACLRGDQATCKILIRLGATVDLPHRINSNGMYTIYKSNGKNSNTQFIAHEIQKRSQILCALPPKVEELQQEVQTLKATVAQQSAQLTQQSAQLTQQSAQIATLIAALQAQQSAHGSD
jgi:hypothetical protein